MAINKEKKQLAESILKAKNKNYDDWLNEKHQEIIANNTSLLMEALKLKNDLEK